MQTTVPSYVITGVALPRTRAVTAFLVIGFALLTAAAAQVTIALPFTPVPITGQTFAVLLAGASLGATAGASSQLLYVLLGAVGLPFYADGASGVTVVQGASGGYLMGFVVAAAVVGALSERRQDRSVVTAIPQFLLGSVIIYLVGVPWLAAALGVSGLEAISLGLAPFVIGDLLKVGLAGLLLPAAWKAVDRSRRR